MLDSIFFHFINYLHYLPNIFVSFINVVFCIAIIFIVRKRFGYSGLCGYMILSSVIANIQVLYATYYEIFNVEVLLGTTIFCSSFLVCDIINIEYGEAKAKAAIYLTMLTDVFFLVNILLTLGHKPLDYAQYPNFSIPQSIADSNISAIKQIFLPVPRLLISSYLSYFISQVVEIKLLNFIRQKNTILKHNIILGISNVFLDTFIFTYFAMCIFSNSSLSFHDFWEISYSSIGTRLVCNFINTICIKRILKHNNY